MQSILPAEMVLSFIRHVLTAIGGVLIARGTVSADLFESILGAIMAIFSALWGVMQKIQSANTTKASVATAAVASAEAGKPTTGVVAVPPTVPAAPVIKK